MRTTALALLLLSALAPDARAQSNDRRIERMAERIAAAAERAAERATAAAERAAREIEKQFDEWDSEERRGNRHWSADEMRIDTTFTFSKDGTVDLSSVSGDIVVTGWTRGEARVRAYTERGQLKSNFTSSRLTIEAEAVRGRMGETRYEVSVPQGARIVLRSRSGDLTAQNTMGAVDMSTTSGDVILTGAKGRVTIESVSGEVQASKIEGDVEVTAVSADVEIDGVTGSVRVESTGGDIVIDDAKSGGAYASTVSGEVTYRGSIDAKGRYEFLSFSGDVALEGPRTVSAQFSVETFSGELDSDFPVTLQPNAFTSRDDDRRGKRRRLEFTVGGGEARVIAESFSGDVNIRRQ